MIEQLPPIEIKEPEYPANFTKHNLRQRKKMKILQYSNAIVSLILPEKHSQEVISWWEGEYQAKGEEFFVEVYTGLGFDVEVNFLSGTAFHKCTGKNKDKYQSVKDEPEWHVIKALSMLPEGLQSEVSKASLSDWDYIPVEDPYYEAV